MREKPRPSDEQLFAIAEIQQGYFTAKQAKACGYQDNTHPYHVHRGNWIRVCRGIYRLARFPQTERPDLIIWALWSCNRIGQMEGVYSHQTALSIHQLSDIMPEKLHMTVPPSFRRNSTIPPILVLHNQQLKKEAITSLDGYFVTNPYQTLLDVIKEATISHDLIFQAIQAALTKGIITRAKLAQLLSEPAVQTSPIYRLLGDI